MKRRAMLKAAIGACAAMLFPWRKAEAQSVADAAYFSKLLKRNDTYRLFLVSSCDVVAGLHITPNLWGTIAGMQLLFNLMLEEEEKLRKQHVLPSDCEVRILPPGKSVPRDWRFPRE